MSSNSEQYPDQLVDWLSLFDLDEASDGAWQAMIENGVEEYNNIHGTSYDSNEGFLWYVERRSQ